MHHGFPALDDDPVWRAGVHEVGSLSACTGLAKSMARVLYHCRSQMKRSFLL